MSRYQKIKFFINSYYSSSLIYIIGKESININFKIITKERIKKKARILNPKYLNFKNNQLQSLSLIVDSHWIIKNRMFNCLENLDSKFLRIRWKIIRVQLLQ